MRVTDSGEKPNKSHEVMKSNGMEVVSFFSVLFFPSLSSPLPNFSLSLCSQIQKEGSHEIDKQRETWMQSEESSTTMWLEKLWMEEPGRLQSVGLQRVGHD